MKVYSSTLQLILVIVLVQVLCIMQVDAASTPESTPNMSLQGIMHLTLYSSTLCVAFPSASQYTLVKLRQTIPTSDANLRSDASTTHADMPSFETANDLSVALFRSGTMHPATVSSWYRDSGCRAPPLLNSRKGMTIAITNC